MTDKLELLRNHIERTGVGANSILRNRRHELPEGLNSALIRAWLNGKILSQKPRHIDYLLDLYNDLPDNPWIDIDETLSFELEKVWMKIRGQLRTIYRKRPPNHEVQYSVLYQILSGATKRTRKLNIDYLLGFNSSK